uniref:UDP-N-acetylglucosamine acyltransferase n=1 Tax=Tetraselmis sp. GSL018 TaxID=582737 RepID=A0A061SG14_9CHLO
MNIERTLLAVSATLLRNLRRDAQLAESIGALSTRRLSTYGQRALEAAADISPAAYVHPSAWLGNSVSVGPFCVVGPRAVIGDGCQLLGNNIVTGDTVLGSDNIVRHGAILGSEDPGKTVIGNGNTIGHHAVIGALCQDLKREPSAECFLRIGNGNDIREFVAIHRSSTPQRETSIRDGNLLMGGCHIAHDVRMGSSNIVGNNSMFAGHVNVGDFVRVSGGVGVQPRVFVGSYSYLTGGCMVDRDVPPYTVVQGDRARIRGLNEVLMSRCGFSLAEKRAVRAAYHVRPRPPPFAWVPVRRGGAETGSGHKGEAVWYSG